MYCVQVLDKIFIYLLIKWNTHDFLLSIKIVKLNSQARYIT